MNGGVYYFMVVFFFVGNRFGWSEGLVSPIAAECMFNEIVMNKL